ncbi:glutamate-1-semialdehyde 2,1-aminomutase [Cyclobacteriaceae bacterium]|nr:glutamate-1-semialdehyde 2,1-aminomutase [Cyclobacteriaceae bacterium]
MEIKNSKSLFESAQNYIPGGVNSPVRAFKAVGGNPIFMKAAKGAFMYDEDGNEYIDMINSWGPMILGHAHPEILGAVQDAIQSSLSFGTPTKKEVDIAKMITEAIPFVEKIRMVNSGTEATMSAIRLARGFTGRDKIIKFEGCYHGHGDSFLIAAGSGAVTFGTPNSPGVTEGTAKDTLTAVYNNLEQVKELVRSNKDEVAAIILEPVAGNMGCVIPDQSFMDGLRSLCDQENIVLIFDEVMTGFRLSLKGSYTVNGVAPDLVTYGKIIGGGMPVGAYGGKKEIMDYVSPEGPVYQAGTLSGNPVAMAAGYTMISLLKDNPEIYTQLEQTTLKLVDGLKKDLSERGLPYKINHVGSMYNLFFTDKEVKDFDAAKACDMELFGKYFQAMLKNGVYLPPSQYETYFVSSLINDELVDKILTAHKKSLDEIL